MKNEVKTRKVMPKGKEFSSEYQPEGRGRPLGSVSLETRIRRMLEEGGTLPKPIKDAIRAQCGEDAQAVDAMIAVGMLQALQGDKGWAALIWEHGWGKANQKAELTGKDGSALFEGITVNIVKNDPTES